MALRTQTDTRPDWTREFPHGWRWVCPGDPDESEVWWQVPLTLDDVLHPREDDEIMSNTLHERIIRDLMAVLEILCAHDDVVLLHGTQIAWDVPGMRPHRPVIGVVFMAAARREWRSFDVAAEGVRPTLLIEVTSPETRHLDLRGKRTQYARVGVPWYVIVDCGTHRSWPRLSLLGYRLIDRGYVAIAPNDRGWLWVEPIGLYLAVEATAVVGYTRDGEPLAGVVELAEARDEAEERAELAEQQARAEAARRAAPAARVRELEARLRRYEPPEA